MNIFEFAIKMEVDGDAFYQQLSDQSNDTRLKKIFLGLSQDEQKHRDVFMDLKEGAEDLVMASTTLPDDAKSVFDSFVLSWRSFIPQTDLGAYKLAMDMETRSCQFYGEAAASTKDPATRKLLLKIADEEHKHFIILENLYDFELAPHLYKGGRGL
ncbi:MAG: ferritin family protein [Desulfuromusa sp.]|jgi:rubrerythrin|nr:ferritin family protein [Desulfuromusa sp.]